MMGRTGLYSGANWYWDEQVMGLTGNVWARANVLWGEMSDPIPFSIGNCMVVRHNWNLNNSIGRIDITTENSIKKQKFMYILNWVHGRTKVSEELDKEA